MNEIPAIARALADGGRGRGEVVLATLVRLEGSGYRRPGARMLVEPDVDPVGFLSGGCLEGDVRERAARVASSGRAEVATYDLRATDDDVWGLALGCNGVVDILIEPLPEPGDPGHPAFLAERIASRSPGVLTTVYGSEGATSRTVPSRAWIDPGDAATASWADVASALGDGLARSGWYPDGDGRIAVFVEPVMPPPRVVVIGSGPDTAPLLALVDRLGWHSVTIDPRRVDADPSRIPSDDRTAVVVMTHHFGHDRDWLHASRQSPVAYVGMLGPRDRTRTLLGDAAADPRVHGPVGLDLGATSPEEIALSIVAEIRAALSGRDGGSLRERDLPIHLRPSP